MGLLGRRQSFSCCFPVREPGLAGGQRSGGSEKEAENQGLKKLARSETVALPTTCSQIVKWTMWNDRNPWVFRYEKLSLWMLAVVLGLDVQRP